MLETLTIRDRVDAVFSDDRIRRAFVFLRENESQIEHDQIQITLVPAPPFQESERAAYFSKEWIRAGFNPSFDEIGNVIAPYNDAGKNPLIIGAHLDTVFPSTAVLQLRRHGRALHLPGISDNGAGLVALLWVFRAAKEVGLAFRRPVLGIANVGEEGEGDF